MKTCVLIPSYNEARTIGKIVRKLKDKALEVLVVDDGSSDRTRELARENGATVVWHEKNLGKGASIKKGFRYLLKEGEIDAVIIMDGDGQHDPEDIQKFVSHALNSENDIIVGNRMGVVGNMPVVRFLTNKLMSSLLSLLCKQNIPDTQCGFRLIRKDILEGLNFESNNYDLDSEMLIKASRKGFKIASVPIETIYRDELSRIHPVKDAFRFIGLVLKSYFK